jgi:hypothetical protein
LGRSQPEGGDDFLTELFDLGIILAVDHGIEADTAVGERGNVLEAIAIGGEDVEKVDLGLLLAGEFTKMFNSRMENEKIVLLDEKGLSVHIDLPTARSAVKEIVHMH